MGQTLLPGRQRPLSPPAASAVGLRPPLAPVTSQPRSRSHPPAPPPPPSRPQNRLGGQPEKAAGSGACSGPDPRAGQAGTRDLWPHGRAGQSPARTGAVDSRCASRDGFLLWATRLGWGPAAPGRAKPARGGAASEWRGEPSPALARCELGRRAHLAEQLTLESKMGPRKEGPACVWGDRWGWRMNFRRGKENSDGLVPSPQSAPRGPRAALKPHPASFQEGCAKYSSGIGNVVAKSVPRLVGQTRGEAWVSGHLPSTLHPVSVSPHSSKDW